MSNNEVVKIVIQSQIEELISKLERSVPNCDDSHLIGDLMSLHQILSNFKENFK